MEQKLTLLYVTCKDSTEARTIAQELITRKMAACANIIPGMESIYTWNGAIESAKEVVLIIKTINEQKAACVEVIRRIHSYELPCVLPLVIEDNANPFIAWARSQVIS